MKVLILYKPISEEASSVEAYVREFARETNHTLELVDVESKQGIVLAETYDIVRQPVIVATRDDGSLIDSWQERESWPTISELSAYTQ